MLKAPGAPCAGGMRMKVRGVALKFISTPYRMEDGKEEHVAAAAA